MSSTGAVKVTLGKAGLTPAFIQQLNVILKHHKHVRIAALPSSGRNRSSIRSLAEKILANLAFPCDATVIGFTIVLRRHVKK